MSLIKRADVKNHLSARHRSEIHLARPESQSDASGFPHEESASKDPQVKGPIEIPLNTPSPGAPDSTPIVKSVKP